MGSSDISARRGHPAWSLQGVLLALVVLGILGMHGLATHCPPQAVHTGTTSTVSASSHHAHDFGKPTTRAHASPVSAESPGSAERSTDGDLCMMGVCIAAFAGLVWLLAVARGRANRPWWRTPLRSRLVLPRLRPRLPRPSTLAELSLLRC